ncbi:anti-sigma regulatory factor (Ser/Thr protein kinase)/class 3 adenylate cyclase [Rhodoligotrophos appendicifer]|uniref:ATP-binding protein n=1 Tax=Rhodoligotrophos appendicifer TaxID=987056 RepID=UPI001478E1DE|nr:ATP-binding protein [Rhodoligotrophos appendicifer]
MTAPKIILFAGQRLDPDGEVFPESLVGDVRSALRTKLDGPGDLIGYASASAGGDIIFGEEVVRRGGKLHIHIPCERDDFVSQYVAPGGREWIDRFEQLCHRAASVNISCEERLLGDELLIRFNNQVLQGIARLQAEALDTQVTLLLLWSPSAPPEPGSPADFMDHWPELERLQIIDLDDLRGTPLSSSSSQQRFGLEVGLSPRAIRAILFADIATFTNFGDEELPLLFDLLSEAQQEVDLRAPAPILINTWGDAVHAAGETAHDLADYASALTRAVREIDPKTYGLERSPRFRIALHAGPVFVGLHPLTGRSMIFGHHVNRAARIEPIAVPGEVFASQNFVALLRAEMDERAYEAAMTGAPYSPRYRVEYHDMVALPKRFGHETIYRVIDLLTVDPIRDGKRPPVSEEPVVPALHLSVANSLSEIERIAEAVEAFCEANGFGPDVAHALNLSLDELLTNTITHGFKDEQEHVIDLRIERHGPEVVVRLSDDAAPFDPREAPVPDLDADVDDREIGGLGVFLVREMMDGIDYVRRDGRNELMLTKLVEKAATSGQ